MKVWFQKQNAQGADQKIEFEQLKTEFNEARSDLIDAERAQVPKL